MNLIKAILESISDKTEQQRREGLGSHEICVSEGYDFKKARKLLAEFSSTAHIPPEDNPRRT